MKNIAQDRLIIYLLLFGLLPLILVYGDYISKKELQLTLRYELDTGCTTTISRNKKELHNRLVKSVFKKSSEKDPLYVHKQIESIDLLSEEIADIQKIVGCGFHPEEDGLRKRLTSLTNGENTLSFTENPEKRYATFHETLLTMNHPVEADLADIRKILSRVEGITIADEKAIDSRPHLIINDFRIEKKKGPLNEVYSLKLSLIKREYVK
ncbi:MAG: putative rane protein [Chlamydiia bacterium]|nr:putative rane protein [Chlamydiia bacterium]